MPDVWSAVRAFVARNKEIFIDAAAALSLANITFVNVWAQLLDRASAEFFHKTPFVRTLLGVTVANTVLFAALFFVAMSLRRGRTGKTRLLIDSLYLFALLVPLNIVRAKLLHIELSFLKRHIFLLAVPFLAVVFAMWRKPLIQFSRHVLVALCPLLPVCYIQVWLAHNQRLHLDEFNRTLHGENFHAGRKAPIRVVWAVFDEFDYCMAFERRSPDARLVELDRLEATALSTTRASSPGANTIQAIPGLLLGRVVEESAPVNIAELKVRYDSDNSYHLLTKEPTIFARAQQERFNVGVSGWFLPYCRLFPLTSCFWEPVNSIFLRESFEEFVSLPEAMRLQVMSQMVNVPGFYALRSSVGQPAWAKMPNARKASRVHSISEYKKIHAAAVDILKRSDIDLAFLHWPTPHPLSYYDRRTASFTTRDGTNYFDALALVDRTVGDIRRELEASGDWDNAAVLVTADHPLRAAFLREVGIWSKEEERSLGPGLCSYVPFVLKMPGQKQAARYEGAFNTRLTGDLLLAILRREVVAAADVGRWLDQHNADPPGARP